MIRELRDVLWIGDSTLTSEIMPAGEYFIGDLCYVLDSRWGEVCDKIIDGDEVLEGRFELRDGLEFAVFSTCFGDGVYEDGAGNEYGVDSGSIGCVKVEDIDASCSKKDLHQIGRVVRFDTPFIVRVLSDGGRWYANTYKLCFGEVEIETA